MNTRTTTNRLAVIGTAALAMTACFQPEPRPAAEAPRVPQEAPAAEDRPATEVEPEVSQRPEDPTPLDLRLPPPAAEKAVRWLDQGWSDEVRARVHYTAQGSATFPVPYEWFVALEQPSSTPAVESPLLIDARYLSRFGFIAGTPHAIGNPNELPVGFARVSPFEDPIPGGLNPNPATGQPYAAVGFTCAACHTGQIEYGDVRLLIDGGPAATDLGKFRDALQTAMAGLSDPARAQRFVTRVLPDPQPAQVEALRAQLGALRAAAQNELAATTRATRARLAEGQPMVVEGFARLDALARIGNQVFWTGQRRANGVTGGELDQNYALPNAPVNFPHVWRAPWFDWVQYNGSIMQPMFRNFSEALGVGAIANLGPAPDAQLRSTVDVEALFRVEQDIAGGPPFEAKAFGGLSSPRWPEDVLGPIDAALAKQGERLYAQRCQSCHLPPLSSPKFWSAKFWKKDPGAGKTGQRYLELALVPIAKIGTDPAQATNLRERKIQLPEALGGQVASYAEALSSMSKLIEHAYGRASIPPSRHEELNGNRPNLLRAELGYRPRPLDGIWATPPFLHNGSVPNLYYLLSPVAERPTKFFLGSREYDPKHIGFDYAAGEGLFEFDTSLPGNLNTGHEFTDRRGSGVIGPALSPDERFALIEYIKTL
jgi:mono/diheme cytochrome c family protein